MANLPGAERVRYVQAMFARIAHRYDLMNRLMTAGQDLAWRREVIRQAGLPPGGRLLDLGAGTGDLVFEALRQHPACRPVAADLTIEMMRVGQRRQAGRVDGNAVDWSAVNALRLPFPCESFDAIVSGFLLRNVPDLRQALVEQVRVLKPGGRFVALDTTRPRPSPLAPLVKFHLRLVIPLLGRLVTGQPAAYRYLPDSTQSFLSAEQLAARMGEAGLSQVGFRVMMMGTVAIHWGRKQNETSFFQLHPR